MWRPSLLRGHVACAWFSRIGRCSSLGEGKTCPVLFSVAKRGVEASPTIAHTQSRRLGVATCPVILLTWACC
ncbi:hypothetical protein BC832DRAFT_554612 [Gaertneriomyces semiglobifer]|nr:hypothetical protein BC832DRAFT_554612 [Gaertneriomyces semiglobifer]